MNILIADDHELVRGGLSRIVSEVFPLAKIHEAPNGLVAEKMLRAENWDLLIMDMSMPGKTGLEVLKQVRAESDKTPILIISIHPEDQYAIRVLKAGGNGYITKACPRADFINAVHTILRGKKYISAETTEKLASLVSVDGRLEQHEAISDRELEVMKLIASGKTVSEIASILSLSVATISTYRHRLLEKMKLKNNAELTLYVINNKLV